MKSMKTTSAALGAYFVRFIKVKITQERYNNANKVICVGLRLLEENESCIIKLKAAIEDGMISGTLSISIRRSPCNTLSKAS